MTMAALSPNSVLASPIQVNPQVKTDLQISLPQVTEDSQNAVKTLQTDTVTISPQALKMADYKNDAAKETTDKPNDRQATQLAGDNTNGASRTNQRNALKAYGAMN